MTPKEKAKELVEKFWDADCEDLIFDDGFMTKDLAKKCALITVSQLINEYPSFPRGTWEESRALYWLEVKKELEKL